MRNPTKRYLFRLLLLLWTGSLSLAGCFHYPLPIESHYNKGVEFYDEGKYAQAIEEYKLELRKNPGNLFAKYNLAVVYQDQGKIEQAIDLYQEILQDTEDTNSRINLAAIYYSRDNRDLAYKELETAAENNRDSPEPSSALGEYLERQESFADAEEKYREALKADNKHALTHYRLGRLYCKQGKTGACVENLQKTVELNPDVPVYLEALATELEKRGSAYEAINLLERVSILQPDRGEIFVRLGDLYKSEKLYREAIQRYWTALSFNSGDADIHKSLAEIYGHLTDKEMQELKKMEDQNSVAQTP